MARPPKADIKLDVAVNLTVPLIERLTCPPNVDKAFLKDAEVAGLKVRVTAAGSKSYVFMMKVSGRTMTRTIGAVDAWSIPEARAEARKLRVILDKGEDPRELERQAKADKEKADALAAANALTVGDVWPRYLQEGKPKRRDAWKPGYLADLTAMSSPGGEPKKRGAGLTRPGVIYPLLALALVDVTEDALKGWFDREAKTSKHQAARALMMFRGFLRWCAGQPEYKRLVDRDAGRAPAILDNLPKTTRRVDALGTEQVKGWWLGVEQLGNRTASAYLRTLLLTGARREEIAAMRWEDVDFRWWTLTLADKVDQTRTIPLGPYLGQMLATLPRVGPYVFSGASKSGRIADARNSHAKALAAAGIEHLTIHGLRRSFALLGEQSGAPAGAIAQVQGHKPSATAEGYKPRTMDQLRPYLNRIEEHILSVAGVQWAALEQPGKLALVKA